MEWRIVELQDANFIPNLIFISKVDLNGNRFESWIQFYYLSDYLQLIAWLQIAGALCIETKGIALVFNLHTSQQCFSCQYCGRWCNVHLFWIHIQLLINVSTMCWIVYVSYAIDDASQSLSQCLYQSEFYGQSKLCGIWSVIFRTAFTPLTMNAGFIGNFSWYYHYDFLNFFTIPVLKLSYDNLNLNSWVTIFCKRV